MSRRPRTDFRVSVELLVQAARKVERAALRLVEENSLQQNKIKKLEMGGSKSAGGGPDWMDLRPAGGGPAGSGPTGGGESKTSEAQVAESDDEPIDWGNRPRLFRMASGAVERLPDEEGELDYADYAESDLDESDLDAPDSRFRQASGLPAADDY